MAKKAPARRRAEKFTTPAYLSMTPVAIACATGWASIAIVPMGFCHPGTGSAGDLPPRPECAPKWRQQLLAQLTSIRLTLVIGQYAQAYHLPDLAGSVTDVVAGWRTHWPSLLSMPHPSPRNNRWLKTNPWFETKVLPALRARVQTVLKKKADA